MKTRSLTRMITTALLALLLTGVTVASHAPAAGALDGTAEADVQYGNGNCGNLVMGAPVIGSVRFLRSGDQLTLRYVMTNGDANTAYAVHLYDADTCGSFGKVGSFTSNAAGVGRTVSRRVSVAGSDRFYAAAIDLSTFIGIGHGSLAVDLP
jgi:hypothetical protein